MNYLVPQNLNESKGALAENALKKVSLCLKLRVDNDSRRQGRHTTLLGRQHARSRHFGTAGETMITAAQLRAARGLLDWTRADLAKAAQISPETVKNIEHGTFKPQEGTAENIVKAFAAHDVEFTENEGVRIRRDAVIRFEGAEGFKRFMDDVYEEEKKPAAATGGDKPVCVSSFDDREFDKHLGDYYMRHAQRVRDLGNVKVRVLVQEGPFHCFPEEKTGTGGFREYRYNPQQVKGNVPFYVYGDKLAVMMFEKDKEPQIIVISSAPVAKTYREMFDVLWQVAVPCHKGSAKK
jgi:DNA-binding XRE family transcriptional regulator